ncbi:hypothetical protein [Mesorhizobium sp. YR577]|uniref:hypothetical protein n=1 Tax=Mesorhizobium sp. YR577 TaxID=1884373 RepID=UPI0008E29950|nr:hypothetical protein [Mesorhizobium sp. YR577]SFU15388.1 hypothetical protein SAMN05518861_1163 [Mesorhizobium sp. YR577]
MALAATAAFFAALSLMLIQQGLYVFSPFLTQDDTIFIGRAVFGVPEFPASHPSIYYAIGYLAPVLPIWALKVISLCFFGLLAFAISYWLMLVGVGAIGATLAGVVIALYPASIDQGLFISGSHPTIGATFVMLAICALTATIRNSLLLAFLGVLIGGLLCLVARLTSPSLFLAPAFPFLIVAASKLAFGLSTKRTVWLVALSLIPVAFGVYLGTGYHYSAIVGWTSFDIATVFASFASALSKISAPLLWANGIAIAFLTALVVVAALNSRMASRQNLWFSLALIAASALTFAPSAVTTYYLDRYAVAPFILAAVALTAVAAPLITSARLPERTVAFISAIALVLAMQSYGMWQRDRYFSRQLAGAQAIERIVSANSEKWPINSQIVILLESPLISPTAGLNHWSTWYVRLLSKRNDIIALAGNALDSKPWVEKYADHDPQYWEVVEGRSRRMPMRGLERARPLFAYRVNKSGYVSCPSDVTFTGIEQRTLRPGQSWDNAVGVEPGCSSFVWKLDSP